MASAELATAEVLRARASSGRAAQGNVMHPSTSRSVRLALAGGGTGGHILPGANLCEHAARAAELTDVVWFQTGRAVETTAMESFERRVGGVPFERVVLRLEPAGGGAPSALELALKSAPAVLRARSSLQRHRSDVLLGLGGFTCLPAVLAARSLGLPVALLEINAVAGRATRRLSGMSRRVFHAWPGTLPALEEHARSSEHLWTGPPLAQAFDGTEVALEGDPQERGRLGFEPDRPLLLVLGGSQGALGLNRFLADHAGGLLERRVQVLHQVGPGRLDEAAPAAPGYQPVEFLADVPAALRAATLVLCRGGASTLAEVGALRRPAWVVPYPHHPDRHQEHNARQLEPGVRIVHESELDEERARELARLCGQAGGEARAAMASALRDRVPVDGTRRIWNELVQLTESARRA